jgi:hypothetical protein
MSTNPVQSSDPVLANLSGVRPDLEEANGVPCASKVEATDDEGCTVPVMHACGTA